MSIYRRIFQTIAAVVVFSTALAVVVAEVQAASITSVNDFPTTLQTGQAANHTLIFTTPTGVSEGSTITLSFSTSFDTSTITEDDIDLADDGTDLTTAASCAGTERASVAIASDVVTFTICAGDGGAIAASSQITIEIGTNATASGTGSNRITNPSSVGTYFVTVAGTFGDDGSIALPISADDSIAVTAEVPTTSSGTGTGGGGGGDGSGESQPQDQTPSDTTAPTISDILVSQVTINSAVISWTTNESATSVLDYGFTSSFELGTISKSALATSHGVSLVNLAEGQTYFFRVRSTDASANEVVSSTQTFTTLDFSAPIISNVNVVDVTTQSARVTWETNEAASSSVSYGKTTAYGSTQNSETFETSHSMILSGLSSSTLYHFQILATDVSSNQTVSSDQTFTTDTDLAPANVSQLAITTGDASLSLTWKNPTDEDLAGVRVLRCTNEYPDSPTDSDCLKITDALAQSLAQSGLINDITYYFGVFAYDAAGQFASGALVLGRPSAPEEEVPSNEEEPGEEEVPGEEDSAPEEEPSSEDHTTGSGGSCGDGLCSDSESSVLCPVDCSDEQESIPLETQGETLSDLDIMYLAAEESIELTPTNSGVVAVLPTSTVLIAIPSAKLSDDVAVVQLTIDSEDYLMRLNEVAALYEARVTMPDASSVYTLLVTVMKTDSSTDSVSSNLHVVTPGSVYRLIDGEEAALSNASITLFEEVGGKLIVWDGSPYHQNNPTTTTQAGTFAWYVPSGDYVVAAQAQGFEAAQTDTLTVSNSIVNPRVFLAMLEEAQEELTTPSAESAITGLGTVTQTISSTIREVLSTPSLQTVQETLETIRDIPGVTQAAEISTPALAFTAGASVVMLSVAFDFLPFLQYIFSAPILFFGRRRRKEYGVVYNAISKIAIDLAVVRLYEISHDDEAAGRPGRLVSSRVTDKGGRYFFLVSPGRYRISVTKPGFEFPSVYLKDERVDGEFLDVYHSEIIDVTSREALLTANIPLDPSQAQKYQAPSSVVWRGRLRVFQHAVALVGIIASIIFAVIRPTVLSVSMIVVQACLFLMVKRLAKPNKPIRWGIVYSQQTGRPLSRVVARIFEPKYNKLLETQVTDAKGRYAFLLGPNEYFAVFEKSGFEPKEIRPIDYSQKSEPMSFSQTVAMESKNISHAQNNL